MDEYPHEPMSTSNRCDSLLICLNMLSHRPESIVILWNRMLLIDSLDCAMREVRASAEVSTPFKSISLSQRKRVDSKFVRTIKDSLLIAREVILTASSTSWKI